MYEHPINRNSTFPAIPRHVSTGQLKKKNWPICWPWIYQNIVEEIPEKSRRVVREVYFAWWVSTLSP